MNQTIQDLREITAEYAPKLAGIPSLEFAARPLPHKWSKKEVLGHLIDSAQNNLRRFICTQYTSQPPQITYDQDFWVGANDYAQAEKEHVIMLWQLMNDRICSVLNAMPTIHYSKMCNVSEDSSQVRSLEWLASDYVKHMKHHLNQIIPASFDITYP